MSATESELPVFSERLMGAACTLDAPQLRARLAAWRQVRDRARAIEPVTDGSRLLLAADERLDDLIELVAGEAECCAFYTFTLTVEGRDRYLAVSAGPGGRPAVDALLGLER